MTPTNHRTVQVVEDLISKDCRIVIQQIVYAVDLSTYTVHMSEVSSR